MWKYFIEVTNPLPALSLLPVPALEASGHLSQAAMAPHLTKPPHWYPQDLSALVFLLMFTSSSGRPSGR